MSNGAPISLPAAAKPKPGAAGQTAPSKVTLHLGHLPSKKDIKGPYPRTPTRVDPNNPPWPAYRGYHEYSFAHATMGVRLPTILGKAIDDVTRTLNEQSSEERVVDLVRCIERMDVLMQDLSGNQKLRPIIDDGEADVALWNKEIAKYFQGKDFMNAPWLFAEAYKYRRLREAFTVSKFWGDYDVFYRQKCDTFSRSSDAVFELSMRFAEPFTQSGKSPEARTEAERLMFLELTQVCLWGNSTDLSLLINMTEEQIKSLQATGGDHLPHLRRTFLETISINCGMVLRTSARRLADASTSFLTTLDSSCIAIVFTPTSSFRVV